MSYWSGQTKLIISGVLIKRVSVERDSTVSYPRTYHNVPCQGWRLPRPPHRFTSLLQLLHCHCATSLLAQSGCLKEWIKGNIFPFYNSCLATAEEKYDNSCNLSYTSNFQFSVLQKHEESWKCDAKRGILMNEEVFWNIVKTLLIYFCQK